MAMGRNTNPPKNKNRSVVAQRLLDRRGGGLQDIRAHSPLQGHLPGIQEDIHRLKGGPIFGAGPDANLGNPGTKRDIGDPFHTGTFRDQFPIPNPGQPPLLGGTGLPPDAIHGGGILNPGQPPLLNGTGLPPHTINPSPNPFTGQFGDGGQGPHQRVIPEDPNAPHNPNAADPYSSDAIAKALASIGISNAHQVDPNSPYQSNSPDNASGWILPAYQRMDPYAQASLSQDLSYLSDPTHNQEEKARALAHLTQGTNDPLYQSYDPATSPQPQPVADKNAITQAIQQQYMDRGQPVPDSVTNILSPPAPVTPPTPQTQTPAQTPAPISAPTSINTQASVPPNSLGAPLGGAPNPNQYGNRNIPLFSNYRPKGGGPYTGAANRMITR